jgi:bifunctional ADP-heptose synthase (sugar kinase/adenylyltransferase)
MRENLKYLIVGDTILDESIELKAVGLSLESPTIKTTISEYNYNFGGAANVAKFLRGFGRDVTFATSLCDKESDTFELYYDIPVKNFFQGKNNKKTRYWVSHGDNRYNHLQVNDVNDEFSKSFLETFDISEYDIIAFADYRCGFITESFIKYATDCGKITYASSQTSSKTSNYDRYWAVDYLVCNQEEAKYVDRITNICVTKGADGCMMNGVNYPATPVENVVNTIGAGDCFYAALLATGDPVFANQAAAEFVSKPLHE